MLETVLTTLVILIPAMFTFLLELIGPKMREGKSWHVTVWVLGIMFTGVTVFQINVQRRSAKADHDATVQETVQKTTANVTRVVATSYSQILADAKQENETLQDKLLMYVAKQFDEHNIPRSSKFTLKAQTGEYVSDVLRFLALRNKQAPTPTAEDRYNHIHNPLAQGFEERLRAYDKQTIDMYRSSDYPGRCFTLSAQFYRYGIKLSCLAVDTTAMLRLEADAANNAANQL